MSSYAVTWRDRRGPVYAGKLELVRDGIRLDGVSESGRRISVVKFRYDDVSGVAITSFRDRLGKLPTLHISVRRGPLFIALAGPGVAREVFELLQPGASTQRP